MRQKDKGFLFALRHSAEHVLEQAMVELYGVDKIIMAMGPATKEGFYFDFDTPKGFSVSENDFKKIENRMKKIIAEDLPIVKEKISIEKARKLFSGNPYKQAWLDEIEATGEKVTIYRTGKEFVDLCKGPHVGSTGEIKAFKLLSIAGAYWRGDENNKMLTRIYGTAFPTKKALDEYLYNLVEAKKRDHKKLARELDLIEFSELVGSGLPMYTPKGHVLREQVYNYSRELNTKTGYQETTLPNINRAELFKVSGHYEKYRDDMFRVVSRHSKDEYFLKPMNCPQHCALFMRKAFSYRDMPVRYSAFSMLYRDEQPGEINGILRSRSFAQDDGHCFCRPDQVEQEFTKVLDVVSEALVTYGFQDYWARLSLRDPEKPEKYLGNNKVWKKAERELENIARNYNMKFVEAPGEAAIYGPKIDFMAKDSLSREWQISTVQLDMIMPERFGLTYTAKDGGKRTPLMIHRAIIGSERFIGILIEHFEGKFPVWLSPVQAVILPITDRNLSYAKSINDQLTNAGIRVELNHKPATLGAKVQEAQSQKIPYMLIVGDKEESEGGIALRLRDGMDAGQMSTGEFIEKVAGLVEGKSLEL